MLRFAICDDDPQQLSKNAELLRQYLDERELAASISKFSSAAGLLSALEESGSFDLYLLDIVMPGIDGMELGRRIRRSDSEGAIIYMSSSPDFALESYSVRAFYYLLKPVESQQLFEVLDQAVKSLEGRGSKSMLLKTPYGTIRLAYDNVLYAEIYNRVVRYHLRDGSYADGMSLKGSFRDAVAPLLEDKRFLLCGASFLVNMYYVKMVDRSSALLENGTSLSLPKAACTALRSAWSNYWLEEGDKL